MDGVKDKEGKPQARLILPNATTAVVLVREYGLRKYRNAENWRGVKEEDWEDAMFRHLLKYTNGEDYDSESGMPHLWHALCNLSYLVELQYPDIVNEGEQRSKQ